MKQLISLTDVKQALRDDRFKKSLPEIFSEDIKKFDSNPGCGCNEELESKLQALPPGRKQLAIARYENLVTVVINELDFV